jgi:hypothetical protein
MSAFEREAQLPFEQASSANRFRMSLQNVHARTAASKKMANLSCVDEVT